MYSGVHRSFLLFSFVFRDSEFKRIQENACFPMFTVRQTYGNYRVLLRFQEFSCAFLSFSLTANPREFKKTPVFQCSPYDELWENIVSSCVHRDSEFGLIQENACFLAFTVQLMDRKLREFQRFPRVFSHFLGRYIRLFFSAH